MTDAGRYDAREVEVRLRRAWAETGLYRSSWRDAKDAKGARKTFVVDTPPPTVSGSLHIGHVFSYTHQDVLVRFHRMLGDGICYPMGWDDNGLPTERRVQNRFNIRCEPSRPYEPLLKPDPEAKAPRDVSRRNFIELCEALRVEDEAAFQDLWERIGLSVDWKETYATIDERCRRAAQRSFLEFHRAGHVYNTDAPHLWDVTFRTAVAQAEVEDREVDGHFHTLRFAVEGGGSFRIATTRPELLGACVAVAVHPADDRHRPLVGKRAVTPAYRARVPVVASDRVDREKGTGAVMVCTFGDSTDVQWWREFSLPLREVVGRDGRIRAVSYGTDGWDSASPDLANRLHAELAGLPVEKARKAVVALLSRPEASAEGGAAASPPIEGEPKPVRHAVKFYEKGDRPLELISTRQWYVKVLDKKEMLLAQGRKIRWVPEQMRTRYERWVEGLATDWCISRQRYFGVPFPLWYGADASGAADPGQVLLAPASSLPADPLASPPPGRREEERGKPGGFVGEADVLDTWFTSSLTPQIVSGWGDDPARHAALFPMDLRPQSHEIIRTWAFYTILKAALHDGNIPWRTVLISGWVLDPDRKKMSKSKGNVITPVDLLERYSADAIRYWSARARPGVDTAVDENVFRNGQRIVTKLFNAVRFVTDRLSEGGDTPVPSAIREPLDRLLVARLRGAVTRATEALEGYDQAEALASAEGFFWSAFCDNYLELVKHRLYGKEIPRAQAASARSALALALSVQVRLLAPFLPFCAEEMWRKIPSAWLGAGPGSTGSVHMAPWPSASEWDALVLPSDTTAWDAMVGVLGEVRRRRTERAREKPRVVAVAVRIHAMACESLGPLLPDLRGYLACPDITLTALGPADPEPSVEVRLEATAG